MVAGDIARRPLCRHQPGVVAETLPDAGARAVGERRALDLIGGGCRAPQEIVGKARPGHFSSLVFVFVASGGVGRRCESSQRRSEEHTSELQSLMRSSYAVFCLQTKNDNIDRHMTDTLTSSHGQDRSTK